jgi:hypothetical protein
MTMTKTDTAPRDGWATSDDVQRHYGGISRSTLDRFVAAGVLPPATPFGGKLNRWRWSDIEIADRRLLEGNAAYRSWRASRDQSCDDQMPTDALAGIAFNHASRS